MEMVLFPIERFDGIEGEYATLWNFWGVLRIVYVTDRVAFVWRMSRQAFQWTPQRFIQRQELHFWYDIYIYTIQLGGLCVLEEGQEICIIGCFVTFPHYGNKFKENQKGGTCYKNIRDNKFILIYVRKSWTEDATLKQHAERSKWIFGKTRRGGMKLTNFMPASDQWWTL